jgi:site-specific DNA recombinase
MRNATKNSKSDIRTYAYTRVSTLRQADLENGSLDAQIDEIRHHLKYRQTPQVSFDLKEVFREEGRSAKDTDRPQLKKLMELIRLGEVDALVITKIDRLTRSVKDFYDLWSEFEKHNVQLVSVRDHFDTTTPMGKAMVNMILTFAQLEREMTAERTRNKMFWHAEQGLWSGRRPPGYVLDPKRKGVLLPHPQERSLIEVVFKKYLELGSAGEVAKYLVERSIKTSPHTSRRGRISGGKTFYKTNLLRILRNPVYIGRLRYADKVFDGRQEPIIEKKLFEEVNAHLEVHAPERKNPKTPREHVYLLQGLVICGQCGAYMTPKTCSGARTDHFYYQCTRNGHTNGSACKMRYAPADSLENAILDKLRLIALNAIEIEAIVKDANGRSNDTLKQMAEDRQRLESQLATTTQKAGRLVEVLKDQGSSALRIVGEELKKLETESETLQEQLEDLKQETQLIENESINSDIMVRSLETFADILNGATPVELKSLLPMLIDRVVFHEPDDKGQGRIQLSLYERPPGSPKNDSADVNRAALSCAESTNWLPGQDSNLQPCGYERPILSNGLGLSHHPEGCRALRPPPPPRRGLRPFGLVSARSPRLVPQGFAQDSLTSCEG